MSDSDCGDCDCGGSDCGDCCCDCNCCGEGCCSVCSALTCSEFLESILECRTCCDDPQQVSNNPALNLSDLDGGSSNSANRSNRPLTYRVDQRQRRDIQHQQTPDCEATDDHGFPPHGGNVAELEDAPAPPPLYNEVIQNQPLPTGFEPDTCIKHQPIYSADPPNRKI
ncbi:hypothetical protein ElyMa_004295600 [Elysia marginata]|uniref:Uncharacterized protein n=1 Tax=Elysia marginata TaxID=1093978 RepID=A0AAV4GWN0_9GAST|nr:hypothetical protein ElyMa_004295600 [Elysia marginata]